jgi:hypothetical protein
MSNTVIGATVEIEYQSIGNVRKALKEANAELIAMQDQFGATSQQAIKAAKKVAELKDRIEDARETADLFDPGKKFQAFVTLGSQIAAGFGAVQGAMALIGTESEAVEKSLLKVQSAMALAQGLSQLKDFGKSWQQLNVFIQSSSVFIKANAAANSLAAGAMRMFGVAVNTTSTSFKVLKGAIVSTGIGALLVVVGLVIEKLMAWANQSSRTEKSIEAMNAATKKLNSSLDNQISILEAIGGKEEEIYRLRQQQANNELATLRKTYAERTKEGKKFTDEELERFNQLKTQITVNDINEKKRLQKIEEDKKKDRDKSHASELKDNKSHNNQVNDQNVNDRKNAEQEITQFLQDEYEKRNNIGKEQFEIDIQNTAKLYDEKIALAKKYKLDTEALEMARFNAVGQIVNKESEVRKTIFDKTLGDFKSQVPKISTVDGTITVNAAAEANKRKEIRKNELQEKVQTILQELDAYFNAAKSINSIFTQSNANQLQKLEEQSQMRIKAAGDDKEAVLAIERETAVAKNKLQNEQVKRDKLFAIIEATINTFKAAAQVFARPAGGPPPVSLGIKIAGLVAAIATGIANVAKIRKVKMPAGDVGGGAMPTATSAPIAPQLSPAVQGQALNAEAINNLGNNAMRAYVLNSDIQNNDQRNAYLQRNARIG